MRLTDAYTDEVIAGLDQILELLDRASLVTWEQLAVAGTAMSQKRFGPLAQGVAIAVTSNRAALLGDAWQRIQQRVQRVAAERLPTDGEAARAPSGRNAAERTDQPSDQLVGIDLRAAQVPLCAAVLAMLLGDLLDDQTLTALTEPLASMARGSTEAGRAAG